MSTRQRGETLVGLLVGMALGALVLTAGAQMLAQLMRGHRLALQDAHLQQDLHFTRPVHIGDTLRVSVVVQEKDPTHHQVALQCEIVNQHGESVLKIGRAHV